MESKAISHGDNWISSAAGGAQPLADEPFVMPFVPGQILANKYEILQLLGVGGVGFVVAANHIELAEKVALKFLKPEMLAIPQVVGRFAQEALSAVRIKSEHVARVFDVGSLDNGMPFIVMEFLEGRDLFDVIAHDGPQPIRRAVDYALQVCEALAAAHACGVIHRDIKPENLFLLRRSEGLELIKVLDFGISKVALTGSTSSSKVPMYKTMLPVGSPVYMSPEQIRSPNGVDFRTDIWSLGCVLHELLTGSAPFDAPSLTQLTATILETNPQPPSLGHPEIPDALDSIVARCLSKAPADRFQNVADLALALYPFGSRRCRIYAEHCCQLLKVAGATHNEFELPSITPPPGDGLISGSFPTASLSIETNGPSPATRENPGTSPRAPSSKRSTYFVAGLIATSVAALAILYARGMLAELEMGAFINSKRSVAAVPLLPMTTVRALHVPSPSLARIELPLIATPQAPTPVIASVKPKPVEPARTVNVKPAVAGRYVQKKVAGAKGAGTAIARPAGNSEPDPGF